MLLIDADRVAYNAGWAMDKERRPAYFMVDNIVEKTCSIYDDWMYRMFLTSRDNSNFRFKVAKTREYKGTRKLKRKPVWIAEVRDYLKDKYGAEEVFGYEADDRICMELYKRARTGDFTSTIAISDDKDIRQCLGVHGDFEGNKVFVKDELGEIELVQMGIKYKRMKLKGTGLRFFYAQTLMGDVCDEYPGMYRVGDVAAYNILKDCKTEIHLFRSTLGAFQGNEVLMDEQASLAWMLKEEDIYWPDRKIKLLGEIYNV